MPQMKGFCARLVLSVTSFSQNFVNVKKKWEIQKLLCVDKHLRTCWTNLVEFNLNHKQINKMKFFSTSQ